MNEEKSCDYVENSIEPCKTCSRLMSTLYRREFLKETLRQSQNNEQ